MTGSSFLKKIFRLWLTLCFTSCFASAELEYAGSIDLFGQGYFKKTDTRYFSDSLQSRGEGEVKLKTSAETYRAVLSGQYRADPTNKSREERSYGDIKEAYLQIKGKNQTFKIGHVLVNWESTDVINPFDVVHQKNWRDPLNIWNRSAASLYLAGSKESFSYDLIYIPKQSEALLPGVNSAWLPRNIQIPLNTNDIGVRAPPNFNYIINSAEVLDNALNDNYGGRLQYHGNGFDLSFIGFEGMVGMPQLVPYLNGTVVEVFPKTVIELNGDIELTPRYYKSRVWGSGLTFTHDLWIFRLAGTRTQPWTKNPLAPSYMTDTVVGGVEKSWDVSQGTFVTMLQMSHIKKGSSTTVAGSAALFDRATIAAARWGPTETSQILVAYIYDDIYKSKLMRLSGRASLNETMAGFFAFDILDAAGDSLLGAYDNNDRVHAGISYSF